MEKWLCKMERKYGRYAIRNLPRILVFSYIIGYMLEQFVPANDQDVLFLYSPGIMNSTNLLK